MPFWMFVRRCSLYCLAQPPPLSHTSMPALKTNSWTGKSRVGGNLPEWGIDFVWPKRVLHSWSRQREGSETCFTNRRAKAPMQNYFLTAPGKIALCCAVIFFFLYRWHNTFQSLVTMGTSRSLFRFTAAAVQPAIFYASFRMVAALAKLEVNQTFVSAWCHCLQTLHTLCCVSLSFICNRLLIASKPLLRMKMCFSQCEWISLCFFFLSKQRTQTHGSLWLSPFLSTSAEAAGFIVLVRSGKCE